MSSDYGLSYAGLLIFGIVVVVFAIFISSVFVSLIVLTINTTALLTNESVVHTVGNHTVIIGLPSNPFARDVVNSLVWLLVGLLHIIADPFIFSLVIILSLIIAVLGMKLH